MRMHRTIALALGVGLLAAAPTWAQSDRGERQRAEWSGWDAGRIEQLGQPRSDDNRPVSVIEEQPLRRQASRELDTDARSTSRSVRSLQRSTRVTTSRRAADRTPDAIGVDPGVAYNRQFDGTIRPPIWYNPPRRTCPPEIRPLPAVDTQSQRPTIPPRPAAKSTPAAK